MTTFDEIAEPLSSGAKPIELCAAHWVAVRRNRQGWSAQQQAELDAWLAQSLAHRVAYVRIEATWRRTDRLAALRRPMREPIDTNSSRKAMWMRVGAGLGLLAFAASVFYGNDLLRAPNQIIETPKGGQERLTLADGSQVELNTDSAVRVNLSARSRSVELLRGEAYFDIRHDASRPFVVTVAQHRIVDLGTKFSVRMKPQAIQIALLQGSARIEGEPGAAKSETVVLMPGDVAVATAAMTRVTRHTEKEISERLAWQHDSIVFHYTRLADAVAEFNRYGGPRLVVSGDVATKFKVNGTFQTTGAEDFAGVVHELFGLEVEHRDGTILLSR